MKIAKMILFCLLPLVIVLLAAEVMLRCYYFQKNAETPCALQHYYSRIGDKVRTFKVGRAMENYLAKSPACPKKHYDDFFNSAQQEELRSSYFERYEEIFVNMKALCSEIDATLVMLYVPSREISQKVSRAFVHDLASRTNVPLLDATRVFSKHSRNSIYLLPDDEHLSRFGNQVLAKMLYESLPRYLIKGSNTTFLDRPSILGDFKPNTDSVWNIRPERPYRVIINSQGLRRQKDLDLPKPNSVKRVLCVGDSYTFGPYLSNGDCYPQMLETMLDNVEVINAGKAGYTICDEYSYFEECGQYVEPDVVLLQFSDNDLYGFYPHKRKEFCRGGKYCIRKR